MVFNLNNSTPDIPKITDVINGSGGFPFDLLRVFTYPWVYIFGGWFFAFIFGIFGAVLYIKSDNAMYPVVFFLLMMVLFGGVLSATPVGGLPAATIFVDLIGIFCAFAVGFLIYQIYREGK